jgi:hypothetical protein
LLGNFHVLAAGIPLTLSGAKTEALLCSLAFQDRFSVSRETLLGTLWPNVEHSLAGQSLNSLVYNLHKLLKPWLGGTTPALHEHGSYRLNTEAGVGVDVAAFEKWAKAGDQEAQSGNVVAFVLAYTHAVHLYTGDLTVVTEVQAIVERDRKITGPSPPWNWIPRPSDIWKILICSTTRGLRGNRTFASSKNVRNARATSSSLAIRSQQLSARLGKHPVS